MALINEAIVLFKQTNILQGNNALDNNTLQISII